jgi:hypothetical protein
VARGGALSLEAAEGMMAAFGPSVASLAELESMVALMEQATSVPPVFAAYAIRQVLQGCLTGEGPTACGRVHFSRVVDARDVALLRRMLVAAGGKAGLPVTRAEAEALFDLHDLTAGQPNDEAFTGLFVKAIAHHVLAMSGQPVPPRHVALREEPSAMSGATQGVGHVFAALAGAGFAGVPEGPRGAQAGLATRYRVVQGLPGPVQGVGPDEANWLARRILRDGRTTQAERLLLAFILDEAEAIDPSLHELLARAA